MSAIGLPPVLAQPESRGPMRIRSGMTNLISTKYEITGAGL
jgi:hypothetical protein